MVCSGALTIRGGGKLYIRAKGADGVVVKELTAADIEFDVEAVYNGVRNSEIDGIQAAGGEGNAAVTLTNCTGSIKGGARGIDVKGANAKVELQACRNLSVTGAKASSGSVNFYWSGIRVLSNVTGEHLAEIKIENCQDVTVTGGTAIAMDAKLNDHNEKVNTPVSLKIKNSSVMIDGYSGPYAAVFLNNDSRDTDGAGDGIVEIDGSDVTISNPIGLGIMTSVHGDDTDAMVKLTNSQLKFIAQMGVKSQDSGSNATAGIDMENSIIRMELATDLSLIVVPKGAADNPPLADEDRKGLLVLITPTQNTVTLYEDITIAQDYEFPEKARFINANNYGLNVEPGVTLKIAGKNYYFPNGGRLIINADGMVQVIMADDASLGSMPETGDDSRLMLWLCLLTASAAILAAAVRRKEDIVDFR